MNLITFGDSWFFGTGAVYDYNQPLSVDEYKKVIRDKQCESLSFRSILAEKNGFNNINFSIGASSNQRQFRYANEYFLRDKKFKKDDIVLWGLTSVLRTELYDTQAKKYINMFLPNENIYISKLLAVKYTDYAVELAKLYYNIELYNLFFKYYNIKNYWVNIFNDHEFENKVDNMLFEGRSLLSILVNDLEKNDKQHAGIWVDSDRKIKKALSDKIVNPISLHPTKQTHKKIAELLQKELKL